MVVCCSKIHFLSLISLFSTYSVCHFFVLSSLLSDFYHETLSKNTADKQRHSKRQKKKQLLLKFFSCVISHTARIQIKKQTHLMTLFWLFFPSKWRKREVKLGGASHNVSWLMWVWAYGSLPKLITLAVPTTPLWLLIIRGVWRWHQFQRWSMYTNCGITGNYTV